MQSMSHYQKKSNSFTNINSKNYRPHANPPHVELLRNSQPIQFHSLFQKQKKPIGLSLVSPNSSELNKFKQKLSKYLQERQTNSFNSLKNSTHSQNVEKSEELRNLDQEKTGGPIQTFSKSHKSSSNSLSRRKNIKQCIKQWSSSKQKQKSADKQSRTLQNDDETDQNEDSNHSGSLIVVKKINRQKEKFILTKKEQLQCDFYNIKEVPIHHTQLFFFRKHKKVRTEQAQTPIQESSVELQQPKVGVSMQELLQIRKSVRHNLFTEEETPQSQKPQKVQTPIKKQIPVNDEIKDRKLMMIHQQELQVRKGKSANQVERNRPHFGKNKKRSSLNGVLGEAVQISPWQRRNTTDFSLLF